MVLAAGPASTPVVSSFSNGAWNVMRRACFVEGIEP